MALLIGCLVTAVAVAGKHRGPGARCLYKDRTPTPEELTTVLRNHQAWLESGGKLDDQRIANLCQANLQEADLREANLQKAYLFEANLQEADLQQANLQGAVYEPYLERLPNFLTLTTPDNHLNKLVFHNSPAALITLREAFKKGGMRTQERQLTYAIEHKKRLQAWNPLWYASYRKDERPWLEKLGGKSESLFNYVWFELPSGYGLAPSRALATLSLLILVFSLVYMVALLTASGRGVSG